MNSNSTRRRILALGASGLASIAGCLDVNSEDPDPPASTPPDDEPPRPPGPPNQPPETPAAEISTRSGNSSYTLYELPYFDQYRTRDDSLFDYFDHPDSRVTTVTVDASTITVTIREMQLNRDIRIAAHYECADGSVGQTDSVTLTPESDASQTHTVELSHDGTEHPRRRQARLLITATDHYLGTDVSYLLKEHRFAIIPYTNADESGEHYVNDESLNYNAVNRGATEFINPQTTYTEHIDTATERTRFFVLAHPYTGNKLWTAYSNISHELYDEYMVNRRDVAYRSKRHPMTYAYNASDFGFFTTLAQSFRASLDENGTPSHFKRLQKLGHLLSGLEDESKELKDLQFWSLYEGRSDCTGATQLYIALLSLPEFKSRAAYITCEVPSGGHQVIGLDERDLDAPNPEDIHWVKPSQEALDAGLPDTRYAFFEITKPRQIGEFHPDNYTVENVLITSELALIPELREF